MAHTVQSEKSWSVSSYELGVYLMADSKRKEKDLYAFEKTTVLIEAGIFRYVRHPLYGSLLFLTWGIFLKHHGISLLIISLLSTIFLIITAKIEERENIRFFGERYNDYKNRTRMFVPFLF